MIKSPILRSSLFCMSPSIPIQSTNIGYAKNETHPPRHKIWHQDCNSSYDRVRAENQIFLFLFYRLKKNFGGGLHNCTLARTGPRWVWDSVAIFLPTYLCQNKFIQNLKRISIFYWIFIKIFNFQDLTILKLATMLYLFLQN